MATRFTPPITHFAKSDFSGAGSGWKLNFYSTGTTTRKDTFSDNGLTTANANPVVADSAGRFGDIFLESGTYTVVLTDASDVEIWTADPVAGSIGTSGAVDEKTASYTVTIDDSTKIIAVDATSGNLTVTLLAAAAAGDGFEVTVKKTDSGANTVTVDGNGAETIDGAATFVLRNQHHTVTVRSDASNWQIVSVNDSDVAFATRVWRKGADIASAATLVIGADGNYFDVTGAVGITAVTVAAGTLFTLQFDGGPALTNGAALDLGGADITVAAGDHMIFFATAANTVQLIGYMNADRVATPGKVLQRWYAEDGAVATGTTAMPEDDTIPQNTEGDEYLTLTTGTLKSASSRLRARVRINVNNANGNSHVAALFRDSVADALAVAWSGHDPANGPETVVIEYEYAPGATTAVAFKVRAGGASGTTTVNGEGGVRKFGGTYLSTIVVEEIEA